MDQDFFRLRFIIDSSSAPQGFSADIGEAVKKAFATSQGFYEIKKSTRVNDEITLLAGEARDSGFSGVVVCGGDRAVKMAATTLIGSETALGIVPLGDKNVIASALRIPQDINSALKLIDRANLTSQNLGMIADKYFFSSAGLGFDIPLSRCVEGSAKPPGVSRLLVHLKRFKPGPLVVRIKDNTTIAVPLLTRFSILKSSRSTALKGFISNSNDRIDVVIVPQVKFGEGARNMKRFIHDDFSSIKGVKRVSAGDSLVVERKSSGPIHADGEIFEAAKIFEVKILKKAIKVWSVV